MCERVARMGGLGWAVALACGLIAAGCDCGGGGMGSDCGGNDDCDPGLFCDPTLLTCQSSSDSSPPPSDSGGGDSGGGDSGGGDSDAGSDSAVCRDVDLDGFDECVDCDDNDPLTYPGAPEVCGDAIDNSCAGGTPDVGCGGIGTYVSETNGNNANPGTQTLPVATIAQGMANAMTIGGGVDVYVAEGTYPEAITMADGISLLGGYEPVAWARSPSTYVTVINDTTPEGVLIPTGVGATTELDGFTINGASGGESTVRIGHDSSPIVRGNVLNGPSTTGLGVVVWINPNGGTHMGTPLIERNAVNLGITGVGWPNRFAGIFVEFTAAQILGNTVTLSDVATTEWGILAWDPVAGLLIARNVVRSPAGALQDYAAGIEIGGDGAVVDSNDIAMGSCISTCTGVVAGVTGAATITNNVSFGGDAPDSAGLSITYEGDGAFTPDALIHSNYCDGGGVAGAGTQSNGVRLTNYNLVVVRIVGRFINNIIVGGVADTRYCIFENGVNIDPERLEANDFFLPPGAGTPAGGLYLDEGLVSSTMIATVNALPEALGLDSFEADPMVVSGVPGGDLHLMSGSPCFDTGASTEIASVPFDYEGDTRPNGAGPNIGVDEDVP